MQNYDFIIIGAGITGSPLAYELVKKGFKVLLLEKDTSPNNATTYSYGGIPYWSGTTELTRQLCTEGIAIHRNLSEELEADTEFRDIDLLLTIDTEFEPKTIAKNFSNFAITPTILSVEEACQLEPLLNPEAISGVLRLPHAHINTLKTTFAYQQAFVKKGGKIEVARVNKILSQNNTITGVGTNNNTYYADKIIVCAGGLSRLLLKEAGINVKVYFTHAQVIKTPPINIKLRSLVMPAVQQRFNLEANATKPELEKLWDAYDNKVITSILDAGAIQFQDGSLFMGQISLIITNPVGEIDLKESEQKIRQEIAKILPSLANISGNIHTCLVAFSKNSLPKVGEIEGYQGIYLFSGFTSTLVYAPPLARHLAAYLTEENDVIIPQLKLI